MPPVVQRPPWRDRSLCGCFLYDWLFHRETELHRAKHTTITDHWYTSSTKEVTLWRMYVNVKDWDDAGRGSRGHVKGRWTTVTPAAEPSARFPGNTNTARRLQYQALLSAVWRPSLSLMMAAGTVGDSPIFCLSLLFYVTHMCIIQCTWYTVSLHLFVTVIDWWPSIFLRHNLKLTR